MTTQGLALELNLFCIAILVVILARVLARNDRQVAQLKFRNMLVWHLVVLVINAFSPLVTAAVDAPETQANVSLVLYVLYYASLNMAIRSWFVYLAYNVPLTQKQIRRLLVPVNVSTAIMVGLNATTQWTHLLYFFEGGRFLQGPAASFQVLYLFAAQLVTALVANVIAHRRMGVAGRRRIRLISTYPVIPFAFMLVRSLIGNLPYLAVSNTMALLVIYIGYLDQLISLDPLTGLNNRDHLFEYISARMVEGSRLSVLMMDVNRFKRINDTYGHLEGDRALRVVSNTLREVVKAMGKSSFLARYGGDEFIIVTDSDATGADELKGRIGELLAQAARDEGLPYELTVSVGVARYDSATMKGPEVLIGAADAALYREKESYRRHLAERTSHVGL